MAVHPIEERYGTPEMRAVWSEKTRFACVVAVEVALAKAEAAHGMIPAAAAAEIGQHAPRASLERAKAIEREISHDMMAMVKAISEVCGDSGRWVHYGATSNDILDTATGLQLQQALSLIDTKLRRLLEVLIKRSEETKSMVCIGRTHGQHGVPTTYGLRFAIWASEVGRHIERLEQTPSACRGRADDRCSGYPGGTRPPCNGGTGNDDGGAGYWFGGRIQPGDIPRPVRGILHVLCKCGNHA